MCCVTISALILAAHVWENSLKNVESDNNKILYETLVDFLQRNGTYFLNKPCVFQTPTNPFTCTSSALLSIPNTCFSLCKYHVELYKVSHRTKKRENTTFLILVFHSR